MSAAADSIPGTIPGDAPLSPFAAARAAAKEKALFGGPYLNKEEKEGMHSAGTPFWLVAIQARDDREFGPRVSYIIVTDPAHAPNGEFTPENSRTLDLASSPFREAFVAEITPLLNAQKILGPLYLTKISAGKGREAWDVVDVPEAGKVHF